MCLVAAMAVSFGTMDWISGGVIAALVILNVSVGGYTEWQAEKVSLGTHKFIRFDPKNMLTSSDCCFS
jgi:magnesium-transporting ATPase (P-type)